MDHLFWANQNNNNTDFTYKYHILLPIFLLGYEKIDKKQNFSAGDIVESGSKEMRWLSYVTWMINIFLSFRWARNLGSLFLFCRPTDRPEIILLTARTTKN